MTCKTMGGSCDAEITGATAEELMGNGKQHVHDLADSGDADHLAIVEKMKALPPEEHEKWKENMVSGFDNLPDA